MLFLLFTAQSFSQSTTFSLEKALSGDPEQECMLGDRYFVGYGVAKDYEKAVKWYIKAADKGNSEAQATLGYCYLHGKGVEKT